MGENHSDKWYICVYCGHRYDVEVKNLICILWVDVLTWSYNRMSSNLTSSKPSFLLNADGMYFLMFGFVANRTTCLSRWRMLSTTRNSPRFNIYSTAPQFVMKHDLEVLHPLTTTLFTGNKFYWCSINIQNSCTNALYTQHNFINHSHAPPHSFLIFLPSIVQISKKATLRQFWHSYSHRIHRKADCSAIPCHYCQIHLCPLWIHSAHSSSVSTRTGPKEFTTQHGYLKLTYPVGSLPHHVPHPRSPPWVSYPHLHHRTNIPTCTCSSLKASVSLSTKYTSAGMGSSALHLNLIFLLGQWPVQDQSLGSIVPTLHFKMDEKVGKIRNGWKRVWWRSWVCAAVHIQKGSRKKYLGGWFWIWTCLSKSLTPKCASVMNESAVINWS